MESRKITAKIGSFLWYGTVTVIIVTAVVLVLTRIALPRVESYRVQVEHKISAYIGQPVKISSLDARLIGISPSLIFKDVSLLDKLGEQTIARFSEAHINLDIVASLRSLKFTFGKLTVLGARLQLERRADGSFLLQGVALPVIETKRSNLRDNQFVTWLLSQKHMVIKDSHLEWYDQLANGLKYIFEDVNLELRNRGERHQLSGSAQLPGHVGESVQLAIDIKGDVQKSSDWQGDIYVKVNGLHSLDWLPVSLLRGIDIQQGSMNTQVWSSWKEGMFHSGEGEFTISDLALSKQSVEPVTIERASGQVVLLHENESWDVGVNILQLQRDGHAWQPSQLQLEKSDKDKSGRLLSSYLNLEDIAALAMFVPGLKNEQLKQLRLISPYGEVKKLAIEYLPDGTFRAQTDFYNVGLSAWGNLPGIDGLDGDFQFDGKNLILNLDSTDAIIELSGIFRAPIELSVLKGVFEAQKIGTDWQLNSDNIDVRNADINALLGLTLTLPKSGVPYMDLRGEFRDGRAEGVSTYYPTSIMKDSLVEWLEQAFIQGRILFGGVIFHGPVKSFPFIDKQGRFEVAFTTDDLELVYMKGWPHLTDVESEVVFEGTGMDITVNSAWMFNSHIRDSRISIPRFKTARLAIEAEAQGPLSDVLQFVIESPLVEPLTDTLSSFKAGGESRVEAVLDIPLAEKEKEDGDSHVAGHIYLDNNRLQVFEGVELTQLSGTVGFDDTDFDSEQLSAHIFSEPASLAITTEGTGNGAITQLIANGHARGAVLDQNLDLPFLSYLNGRSAWDGLLTIPHRKNGEILLNVESDLQDMAIDLPDPLGKLQSSAGKLMIHQYLSGARSGQLLLNYNDLINVNMKLKEDNYALQRMGVHIGKESIELPDTDIIYLTGALGEVNLTEWGEIFDVNEGSDDPLPPLQVALESIHIISDEGEERGEFTDLSGMPPVSAWVGKFSYDNMHFEQLAFQTSYQAGRMDINDIFLVGSSIKATGAGHWYIKNNRTEIQWQLESEDFGGMMKTLDTVSGITKGKASSQGLFYWPGSPADFHWGRLGGKASVQIKNGSLDEVEPGSARLLGLLSLHALPKRLFLDFSDMFTKGVDFSWLGGDFKINRGDVSTNNLKIKTLVGEIFVSGRTHLEKEDIDQLVTVNPDVTGSLPVAGYLAGGPQLGVVMLFFKQVFGKSIAKANKVQYRVTGTWDNPVITELKD